MCQVHFIRNAPQLLIGKEVSCVRSSAGLRALDGETSVVLSSLMRLLLCSAPVRSSKLLGYRPDPPIPDSAFGFPLSPSGLGRVLTPDLKRLTASLPLIRGPPYPPTGPVRWLRIRA
jgi:hypothetical protein